MEIRKTTRYFYYGPRKQINNYYLRLELLKRKILIVADTKFRAYMIYRICLENSKFKIKILHSRQFGYSHNLNAHDLFITTTHELIHLSNDENFSINDFKTIILDDVSDLTDENSLFRFLIRTTKCLFVGLTSNLKHHVLQNISHHFDQVREMPTENIHFEIHPVTQIDKFKVELISLMKAYQYLTSKFLMNIPYGDYDYATVEMDHMLQRLVEFSAKEGLKNLNFATQKLLQVHQAIIMSQQETPVGVLNYLDNEIGTESLLEESKINLENRSDYLFQLETTKEEFNEIYLDWKSHLRINKMEKPVQFDDLLKLVEKHTNLRILIITSSPKNAKFLAVAWETAVHLIDPESLKDSKKFFKEIQDGTVRLAITTRAHFDNILKKIYRKSLCFDLYVHYDGILDSDFASKSIYFANQSLSPPNKPIPESKLKVYPLILSETLSDLKKYSTPKNKTIVFESNKVVQQSLIQTVEQPVKSFTVETHDVRFDIGKNLYDTVDNPISAANNLIMKYFKEPPRYEEQYVPSKNAYFCRIYVPSAPHIVTEAWGPKKKDAKASAAELMIRKVHLMHL